MLDEGVRIKFIKLLKEIVVGDLRNVDKYFGLYFALDSLTGTITTYEEVGYSFVVKNCVDWKYFSGNPNIPTGLYDRNCNWEGKQLKLRQSLAQHLLTKLEENTYVL